MKTLILSSMILACALSGPVATAGDKPPAKPAASMDMTDARMTHMREHMTQMQEQMAKLQSTSDPKERQRMMQEHMQAMREHMTMMRGMGGSGTGGGKMLDDHKGMPMGDHKDMPMTDMMGRHNMMESRMDMMEMMMEQMMQHEQMRESMPVRQGADK